MKKYLWITGIIFLLSSCMFILNASTNESHGISSYIERIYSRAEITKIEHKEIKNSQGIKVFESHVFLKILSGELEGKTKNAIFGGENDLPQELAYKVGDKVFVGISRTGDELSTAHISIYDVDNTPIIIVLVVLFFIAIISVGRVKGLASLVALIVTMLLLFLILIPLTLKGYPPLPFAVLISIISILITLPIIAGFKLKTFAAVLGASGGIILSSLLAVFSGLFLHLSGIVTNDMLTVFYTSDVTIDLRGLVLSGMIISALGAIMDISISISSSASEIFSANNSISEKEAFKSVLNIGTDILGSMVNTLILAYVGSSLSLILIISMKIQPGMPVWMIFNYNPVLSEIVKSIVGSIGMFVSIPLTAIISVKLYKRKYAD